MADELRKKVEAALGKVRPYLQADGGDVQLVEIADGVVKVKMTGACGGCPMSAITLNNFVVSRLKKEVPEVKEVVAV